MPIALGFWHDHGINLNTPKEIQRHWDSRRGVEAGLCPNLALVAC